MFMCLCFDAFWSIQSDLKLTTQVYTVDFIVIVVESIEWTSSVWGHELLKSVHCLIFLIDIIILLVVFFQNRNNIFQAMSANAYGAFLIYTNVVLPTSDLLVSMALGNGHMREYCKTDLGLLLLHCWDVQRRIKSVPGVTETIFPFVDKPVHLCLLMMVLITRIRLPCVPGRPLPPSYSQEDSEELDPGFRRR